MREWSQVTIRQAIFHEVAPNLSAPTLSQGAVALSDHHREFLTQHVLRGLKDHRAKAANFFVAGPARAQGLSAAILGDPVDFVETSQKIAKLLHSSVLNDQRISPGVLAVLICSASAEGGGPSRDILALLKLDLLNGFKTEVHHRSGRSVLELVVEERMLPSTRERLQKCAFVRPPSSEYQLLVVDRQTPGIADFFLRDFLGAEFALDDTQRTLDLRRALYALRHRVAPGLTGDQLAKLDLFVQGTLASQVVDLDELAESTPILETQRETFRKMVLDQLPDHRFTINALVLQAPRQLAFDGDNGLKVSIPAEFFEDMVTVKRDETVAKHPMWIITIRTDKWQPR